MIYVQAIRLDGGGAFRYIVEASDGGPILGFDPESTAEALRILGVHIPKRLLAHAEKWGTVEFEPTHTGANQLRRALPPTAH
jgi:hypothetical protein